MQNLFSSILLSKNIKIKKYRTIILPVVLYGCETKPLTFPTEEHMLRVSENKVTAERTRLHHEELNDTYFSPNIIWVIKSRRMRWAWHIASIRDRRGAQRVLVGKPEGKRPLGRPKCRWEDITMDLQEVGWGAWTGFIWLRKGTGGWFS